jgi:predicted metal-dependent hydrolase
MPQMLAKLDARRSVTLPDGRTIEFETRFSASARTARLRVGAREGLVVVVPAGLRPDRIQEIVASKGEWIAARFAEFDAVRHLIAPPAAARPEAFDLPALAESWRVEYREMRRTSVGATIDRAGRVVVFGAIDDSDACQAALRRWLARRASESLPPWLMRVAAECGPKPSDISIKNQRTRWGSCAGSGRISLNCKLLFLPRALVRYVMVHELAHLLEPNHSNKFWSHVRQMDHAADTHHGQMRDAWKLVPTWAQRGVGLDL